MTDTTTENDRISDNMTTHLVVAVHGIGEQKPGETIDSIVGAATTKFVNVSENQDETEAARDYAPHKRHGANNGVAEEPEFKRSQKRHPVIVERDVLHLAETDFDGDPRQAKLFPVHMRRVRRANGASPNEQTVFAEVFWADKSPAPSGPFWTAIDLLRVILGLGYLAMENVESNRGWFAVGIVHLFAWAFYVLVAPMNAVLLIGAALLLIDMTPLQINQESTLEVIALQSTITLLLGGCLFYFAQTFLIRLFSTGLIILGTAILIIYLLNRADIDFVLGWCTALSPDLKDYFPELECFIDLSIAALGGSWILTVLLALLTYLTVFLPPKTQFRDSYRGERPSWFKDAASFVRHKWSKQAWLWNYKEIEDEVGPFRSIYPSICAGMVIFWMVISSAFWLLFLNLSATLRRPIQVSTHGVENPPHNHLPDSLLHTVLDRNLSDALKTLAITAACLVAIIAYCVVLVLLRKGISYLARKQRWSPVYRQWPILARIILNPGVRLLFVLSLLVISCALLQQVSIRTQNEWAVAAASGIPEFVEYLIELASRYHEGVTIVLLGVALAIYYFSNTVAGGLGVVRDIVVYATRKKCEWLSGRNTRRQNFKHRDDINDRFIKTLHYGLETFKPIRLTIISHSQGTVIATHMLQDDRVKMRLKQYLSGDLTLITMGSPVTHVYRRYFKEFFSVNLEKMMFRERQETDTADCVTWYNIFRTDDFVGTYVGEDKDDVRTLQPDQKKYIPKQSKNTSDNLAINYAVEARGHSGYFTDHQVWRLFLHKDAVNFRLFPSD